MRFVNTILLMAFVLSTVSYSLAEADYPALTKNSRSRSSLSVLSTDMKVKSEKDIEKDKLTQYYLASPNDKPKTGKYSITGEPKYKDPSILRKNREKVNSKYTKNSLIADPAKISRPKRSYSKYYKRKEYNYDFLYEQEPAEEKSETLKLTL